jgi:hypothetical protein
VLATSWNSASRSRSAAPRCALECPKIAPGSWFPSALLASLLGSGNSRPECSTEISKRARLGKSKRAGNGHGQARPAEMPLVPDDPAQESTPRQHTGGGESSNSRSGSSNSTSRGASPDPTVPKLSHVSH